MKSVLFLLVFVLAGYFAWQQFKPNPPPPPPPPPPPAINLEPLPVINEEEQAKVVRAANDQDPDVRWEAMIFLDKMKSPKALAILFEKLHKDSDAGLRIKVVRHLSEKRGPEISQNLVWALKDNDPEVRIVVLQALEKMGDFATASAITESLRDQEESVRLQALKTLNSLQDKKAAELAAEQARQEELRRQAEAEAAAAKKR